MNRSYVAIVTRRGLEALYPEEEQITRFLDRRVYRKRPLGRVCYWAVLPDQVAKYLELQLDLGENQEALRTLQTQAIHSGPILPLPPKTHTAMGVRK